MADRLQMPPWLIGLLVFIASTILSVFMPALSPFLGGALLVAGLVGHRQTTNPGTRRVAMALLVSGLALLVLVLMGSMLIVTNVAEGTVAQ